MNLIVDIGNTLAKLYLFEEGEIVARCRASNFEDALSEILVHGKPEGCAVATVAEKFEEMEERLRRLGIPSLNVSGTTPTPLKMAYHTAETLGADRIAAAAGAWSLMPENDLLIVDAGTCITYDFVSKSGEYRGGNIALGIAARLAALQKQTERLPLIEKDGDTPLSGYNTETAIRSGVVRGVKYELEGHAAALQKQHPALRIVVTGGDAAFLCKNTDIPLCIDNDLVARGLNCILSHNEIH